MPRADLPIVLSGARSPCIGTETYRDKRVHGLEGTSACSNSQRAAPGVRRPQERGPFIAALHPHSRLQNSADNSPDEQQRSRVQDPVVDHRRASAPDSRRGCLRAVRTWIGDDFVFQPVPDTETAIRAAISGSVTSGWSLNGRTCTQSRHAARQPRGAQWLRGDVSTNLATRT